MALNKDTLKGEMGNLGGIDMNGDVASQIAAIQAEAIAKFVKTATITIPKGTVFSFANTPLPLDADVIIENCLL